MSYEYHTTAIEFMNAYREVEKGPKSMAHHIIRYVVKDDYIAAHLCGSWNGRKQDFGDFYLNLTNNIRYEFLKFWGLAHPDGDQYVKRVSASEIVMLFADAPSCIAWPTELLKFFYNHGIIEECEKGVTLTNLPPDDKCYGNSSNWADYILSLTDDERRAVLDQIAKYYEGRRSKQS